MSGAILPVTLYAFMVCTGAAFTFLLSIMWQHCDLDLPTLIVQR